MRSIVHYVRGTGIGFIFAGLVLTAASTAESQAQNRCDLILKSTPGVGAQAACLDLIALTNGGPTIQTVSNATRIGQDGFKLCKNAFEVKTSADADVVFIYDISGSMMANLAYIDPNTNDTLFYFDNAGCESKALVSDYTMNTYNGPRIIHGLQSNNGCTSYSGDPYEVRAQVIKSAIDYMALTSPTSTAGVVGFALETKHGLAPLQLNTALNVKQVKDSIQLDSIAKTFYSFPLDTANKWLNDPTITKTQKRAIVFISDGAPDKLDDYLPIVDLTIPIYSIFLGQVATPDTLKLKQLSDSTRGTFNRVQPKNIAAINSVMQTIIRSLLISTLPRSIEITNASFAPPQISKSTNFTRSSDSSISLTLDSIVGLNKGLNNFKVKIKINDTLTRNYAFNVQADGPLATTSTSTLNCFDPPSIVMLNTQGKQDSVYSPGTSSYSIVLKRSTNDLASVEVKALSKDSTMRQPWGDAETIKLNLSGGVGSRSYQSIYPINGSSITPVQNNNTLESDATGKLVLTWTHPRDAREFAIYELPGKKIPTVKPFIEIERVNAVSKGLKITKSISNPIVIFGDANLIKVTKDSSSVTHGLCLANCIDDAMTLADPNKYPSFVFKTAAPFSYELFIYDHLGNFVNNSKGVIDAVKWQSMPKKGDSVAVVMSFLPVSKSGANLGTGAYILRGTIKSLGGNFKDAQGFDIKVSADSRMIMNRFGYLRR